MAVAFYYGAKFDGKERYVSRSNPHPLEREMLPARPVSENDPNTRRKSRSPSRPVRARREKLFKRINALPTVYEILSGKATAKPKANKKPPAVAQVRLPPRLAEKQPHVAFRAFLLPRRCA